MNKYLKAIIAVLIFLILRTLIDKYIQPGLNRSGWDFFPAFNVVMIPFWYYLVLLFGWGAQFGKFKRLLGLCIIGIVLVFLTEFFVTGRIFGSILAYLIGALLTAAYLLIEKAVLRHKESK